MAQINSTAVWRVRIAGNILNGGGYDAAIPSAGTDYSQQDAAQLTLADLQCLVADDAGRLVVRSATGGFTAAMIGNAMKIAATGTFTAGYYFITAVGSTNTATVSSSPAGGVDRTGGACRVGGGLASYKNVLDVINNALPLRAVPGNIVYVRGAGSDLPHDATWPTVADYTEVGYCQMVQGDETSGSIHLIGENGRPRIKIDGLIWYNQFYLRIENFHVYLTNTNNMSANGVLHAGGPALWRNIVVNTHAFTSACNVFNSMGLVVNCEVWSGSLTPGAVATTYNAFGTNSYCSTFLNCIVHHFEGNGFVIHTNFISHVLKSVAYACKGDGVFVNAATDPSRGIFLCAWNTIDANEGHGINIPTALGIGKVAIFNNIISNHVQAGKFAISVGGGTAVDKNIAHLGFNDIYNNTGTYSGISGPNLNSSMAYATPPASPTSDQTLDPQYSSPSTYDWTIGTNLKALGFPSAAIIGELSRSFEDIGAFQRQEPASGSTIVVNKVNIVNRQIGTI